LLDLIASLGFLVVQWRLAVILLRRIRLSEDRWRKPAWVALAFLGVVVAAGWACAAPELSAPFGLTSKTVPVFGALTMCYTMLATVALTFHAIISLLHKHLNTDANPGRRRVLKLVGNTAIAAPFAVVAYGALVKRTDFQIREVDIPLAALPADLDGLRLLHLSDIHLSVFLTEQELARAIDMACDLRPHIAFFTGDFISTIGDPLEACIRQLSRVKADAGMFTCLGNHERYARAERQATELAGRCGIPILRGAAQTLRFGNTVMNVAGVDYQSIYHKEHYLTGADRLVAPGAVNLLLSHNPDVFPVAVRQGYDFVLAGHTHGGQVTVEILDQGINPARFFTPFVRGLYREEKSALYVTPGIGTIGIPARLGVPPEISLLRLRKA